MKSGQSPHSWPAVRAISRPRYGAPLHLAVFTAKQLEVLLGSQDVRGPRYRRRPRSGRPRRDTSATLNLSVYAAQQIAAPDNLRQVMF